MLAEAGLWTGSPWGLQIFLQGPIGKHLTANLELEQTMGIQLFSFKQSIGTACSAVHFYRLIDQLFFQ